MTTMPMGPRRQSASTGERRETTDPPLQGRGSGSAGKKRSEPRRYMGVRFTERQRDLIKMAATTAESTCTTTSGSAYRATCFRTSRSCAVN